MPRNNSDTKHGVFFTCDTSAKCWCAYVTEGALPGGGIPGRVREGVYLKLFFACFEWNTEITVLVLASLNLVDSATGMLLEPLLASQLSQRAKNLVVGAFGDSLVDIGVVRTHFGLVRLDSTA